jgi:cytochrome c551/c552
MKKLLPLVVGGLVLGFILIQFVSLFVPKLQTTNPEVSYTVQWDSPETQALWDRACNDCHSNETIWPWYSHIAPISWLVAHDVNEGRSEGNISEGHELESHEMIEKIREGEMPMTIYVIMHPEADLSDAETEQLISGLRATFGR